MEIIKPVLPPPRYILGVLLLFWGIMTDRPMIGILLALIVESAHWQKFRWDFNEEACDRAWRFTTLAIFLASVLIFLEGTPYDALPTLLTWLPPLLLPMQFIQVYGFSDSLPLNTFSFLAKYRRRRNTRLGLTEPVIHVNFGNIYFVATMVASTLGSRSSSWMFLPGIIILTGWMLLAASRSRPLSLIVALTVAGGIAVAGQLGLNRLQEALGNSAPGRAAFDPDSVSTLVGTPGDINQSPDIVWRIRTVDNAKPPLLLRTASYNAYATGRWKVQQVVDKDFKTLDAIEPVVGQVHHIVAGDLTAEAQSEAIRPDLPRFAVRGAASEETPLALPGNAASLDGFEVDSIERNGLGTVRVFPKQSVIEGTVAYLGEADPEAPPRSDDLFVLNAEEDALQAVSKEIGFIEQPTLKAKLATLRAFFQREFSYSRQPRISISTYGTGNLTAVGQFLTNARSGHCEYFATAATLLLREAGIPARYATGYAVAELDPKRREYVIRGTHGHAWTRVWDADAGRWLDFDTTPGSWFGTLPPPTTLLQRFNDATRRVREDFFLWRNRPANRLGATLVMSAIGLGVVGFVVKRLWKSKRRLEAERKFTGYEGPVARTPLNTLEGAAEKLLGPRPLGQPLAAWLLTLRPTLGDAHALEEAIELHQRLRFDPAPVAGEERERLAQLARSLESVIRRA